MRINSAGKKFILISALLLLIFIGALIGGTDAAAWYLHMADDYPARLAMAVPGLVLLALAMAFIRARKKRARSIAGFK
jgi:hypothetical protein